MTFQIGEKIVYPNHGVGTIESISSRCFGAQPERFYLLRFYSNSMTVMVPFSHAEDVGLRKVTRNGDVAKILNYLATGECKICSDWKTRFKMHTEKMRSGSLPEIAEVFKALLVIQQEKSLSFREKKMLDRARQMLVMEVSISRGEHEAEAAGLLAEALAKSNLEMPRPL